MIRIAKRERKKGQTTIYNTLHIKLKIKKRESNFKTLKTGVNSGAPEGLTDPALHVTPVVLLLEICK